MAIPIHHFATIDSTNSEARRRLETSQNPPFWIWADEQTEGRGRVGRHWFSPPGNLYATHCFQLDATPAASSQISFVAALAVHDVASSLITSAPISLKWPNDCLIDGAKFSGILAEMQGDNMILGMGLNVLHEPKDVAYRATALAAHGYGITVQQTFEYLKLKLKKWLQIWDNSNGFHHIHRAWEARCDAIGKDITLDNGHTTLNGTFAGLAPDGALLLNHHNTTTKHYAGDVRIVATENTLK